MASLNPGQGPRLRNGVRKLGLLPSCVLGTLEKQRCPCVCRCLNRERQRVCNTIEFLKIVRINGCKKGPFQSQLFNRNPYMEKVKPNAPFHMSRLSGFMPSPHCAQPWLFFGVLPGTHWARAAPGTREATVRGDFMYSGSGAGPTRVHFAGVA